MNFVLIPGAWQDASCWEGVARELRAAGHSVHPLTLAGQGLGDVDRTVGHADAVASAAGFIEAHNLRDFVLVAHSYGGTVASKLAEQMPERIRRLVYLNAFVLVDGECLNDVTPPHYIALMEQLAAARDDGGVVLPYPVWREAFMNDADDELARDLYENHLSPQPYRTLTDRLELKVFPTLETPRSFVNCTEDIALPPGEWGWFPRFYLRLGLCRLVQMPGGHESMYTNPTLLAQKLIEAGRD